MEQNKLLYIMEKDRIFALLGELRMLEQTHSPNSSASRLPVKDWIAEGLLMPCSISRRRLRALLLNKSPYEAERRTWGKSCDNSEQYEDKEEPAAHFDADCILIA